MFKFKKIFVGCCAVLSVTYMCGCTEYASTGSGKRPVVVPPAESPDTLVEAYDLIHFSEKQSPKTIGEGVTDLFIKSGNSNWGNMHSSTQSTLTSYPDICAWLGAFWYAEAAGNEDLLNRLVDKFDLFFSKNSSLVTQIPRTEHNLVDFYIFGAVPLHIYYIKKQRGASESEIKKYIDMGLKYADGQWELPDDRYCKQLSDAKKYYAQGYSWQTRLWIDDMFMITALQSQAYLATGDEKYIERTAKQMILYLDNLPGEDAIYYHAPNARFFWGRGNGWMAVGMPEVLKMLPKTAKYDEYRNRILTEYKKMMSTLCARQFPTGMWGQLIDGTSIWEETSGTAMFTYAMILGVKNGWLDERIYGTAARKGWLALQSYLNPNFEIRNVCTGTGTGSSYEYYRDRAKSVGDLHGQAAIMWCAAALTELANERNVN